MDSLTPLRAADMPIPNLYVIIPVLNESANVDKLCQNLMGMRNAAEEDIEYRYIVVDDGSTDDTVEKLSRSTLGASLTLLRHEVNQGPGAAFRTAFSHLSRDLRDQDLILTMEGDNTSHIEIFKNMLAKVLQDADVVLASPYAPNGEMMNVEWHRLFLSHAANAFARIILGLWGIHTLSSFYRLHSGEIIRKLQTIYGDGIIESDGFEWAVEMLYKIHREEAVIVEIPLKLNFSSRKGKSKMKIIRTINGYLRIFAHSRRYLHHQNIPH